MKLRFLWLLIGGLLFLGMAAVLTGTSPAALMEKMVFSSFSNPVQAGKMLEKFTPLLIVGIGVFWALRAGLFNIGSEGQFMVGGLTASFFGTRFPGPLGIVLAMLGGAAAGGLWALPAAWLKARRGAHEVISTIMLNNIAGIVVVWLITGPLKAPDSVFPATPNLADNTRLGALLSTQTPSGVLNISQSILIGICVLVGFTFWLNRTVSGYELSATGANPTAAKFAGIEASKVMIKALCGSGALCGLAGATHMLAASFRFVDGFSAGYGFDGLGVALLAGANPLAVLPSALLFAVLNNGSTAVQFLGVPKGMSMVILAVLIALFAAGRMSRKEVAHA